MIKTVRLIIGSLLLLSAVIGWMNPSAMKGGFSTDNAERLCAQLIVFAVGFWLAAGALTKTKRDSSDENN